MSVPDKSFTGVKVFCATTVQQRGEIADRVTQWIRSRQRPGFEIVDQVVKQSSDDAFHCLSIILFYVEPAPRGQGSRK